MATLEQQQQQTLNNIADAMAQNAGQTQALIALLNSLSPVIQQAVRPHSPSMVDTRGLGNPDKFSGKDEDWIEWRYKAVSWLKAVKTTETVDVKSLLDWAERHEEEISEEVLRQECSRTGIAPDGILKFASELETNLTHWVKGQGMVHIRGCQTGLEAWRNLNRRYSPKTAGSKRNILIKLLNMKPTKTPAELEAQLHKMDEHVRQYDTMTSSTQCSQICAWRTSSHFRFEGRGQGPPCAKDTDYRMDPAPP